MIRSLFKFSTIAFLSSLSYAGTPDLDPYVKNLQENFKSASVPTKSQLSTHSEKRIAMYPFWRCQSRSAKGSDVTYHSNSSFQMRFIRHDGFIGNCDGGEFRKFRYSDDGSGTIQLYGESRNQEQVAYIRRKNFRTLIIEVVNLDSVPQSGGSSESISDPSKELDSYIKCRLDTGILDLISTCSLF
jgi:hypothetical protein